MDGDNKITVVLGDDVSCNTDNSDPVIDVCVCVCVTDTDSSSFVNDDDVINKCKKTAVL